MKSRWLILLLAVFLSLPLARASMDSPAPPMTTQSIAAALGYTPIPPTFSQAGTGTTWTGSAAGGSEVSLLGAGAGANTITCPYVGATWRFTAGGIFSTAAFPGNITPKITFGGGSVSRQITNIIANGNNSPWKGWLLLTCVTKGAAGTMRAIGEVAYATGDTSQAYAQLNNDGNVITLDNQGVMPIDVRVLMASTQTANVFRLDVFSVERVY